MQLNELLTKRRSIRKYKGGKVTKEQIEKLLTSAQMAPSWKNSETGRYYVALSDEAVAKVYEALPGFNQVNSANASAYIVTAFEKGNAGFMADGTFANVYGDEWGAFDLGCQVMTLLYQASEMGLDTLIMGLRDEKALRDYFAIPEKYEVMAVLAVGYRDIEPVAPKRKELTEIVTIK